MVNTNFLGGKVGAFQASMADIFHDTSLQIGWSPTKSCGIHNKCEALDDLIKMIEIRDDQSVP